MAWSLGLVLVCAAVLEHGEGLRPRIPRIPTAAVLGVLAVAVLPQGTLRGTVVSALLLATLALAGVAGWRTREGRPPLSWWLAAALGAQVLMRGELLLADSWGPSAAVSLLLLPAVGAWGAWLLARRLSPLSVLLAVGCGLIFAGAWTVALSLTLLAVEAGLRLAPRRGQGDEGSEGPPEKPARRWTAGGWAERFGLAGVVMVLGAAALVAGWAPGEAVLVLIVLVLIVLVLATLRPRPQDFDSKLRPVWMAISALPLLAALWLLEPAQWRTEAHWASYLLLLFVLPQGLWLGRRGGVEILLLAVGAMLWVPGSAPLVVAAVPAALLLSPSGLHGRLQRRWSGVLLFLTALLAAYPWVREPALLAVLEVLQLGSDRDAFLKMAVGLIMLLATSGWLHRRQPGRWEGRLARGAMLVPVLFLAVCFLLGRPQPGLSLLPATPQVLDERHPNWGTDLEPQEASALVVESNLSFAADLPAETAVALVRCFHPDGSRSEWHLTTGETTGEWAARRSDLSAAGVPAPAPFVTSVAPEGGFLAQRYRGMWRLEPPKPVRRVSVLRDPTLPPEVQVHLFRVELRP